jgi:hypothetical protein
MADRNFRPERRRFLSALSSAISVRLDPKLCRPELAHLVHTYADCRARCRLVVPLLSLLG